MKLSATRESFGEGVLLASSAQSATATVLEISDEQKKRFGKTKEERVKTGKNALFPIIV